jgi:hypothetical protein
VPPRGIHGIAQDRARRIYQAVTGTQIVVEQVDSLINLLFRPSLSPPSARQRSYNFGSGDARDVAPLVWIVENAVHDFAADFLDVALHERCCRRNTRPSPTIIDKRLGDRLARHARSGRLGPIQDVLPARNRLHESDLEHSPVDLCFDALRRVFGSAAQEFRQSIAGSLEFFVR